MIRLLAGELRADWRSWSGLVLVAAVAGLAIGIGGSFLETGIEVGGRRGAGISGVSSMILVFSGVSAIAVTSAVARLAVDLGRAGYARWQLCGVSPRQTAAVVLGQLAVLSVLGAALGFGASAALASSVMRLAFEGASGGIRNDECRGGRTHGDPRVRGRAVGHAPGRPSRGASRRPHPAARCAGGAGCCSRS